MKTVHQPVLLHEVLAGLNLRAGAKVLDGTLGGGGHAEAICEEIGAGGFLIGLDRDGEALRRTGNRLKRYADRILLRQAEFGSMKTIVTETSLAGLDGILLDLGCSSDQLDQAQRGFSFMQAGPLDMRMDQTSDETAATLLNTWEEDRLADCFFQWGEERRSRAIAAMIVERRAHTLWETTDELAEAIERLMPRRGSRIHPATRVFQALRIAVNREMEQLDAGLDQAVHLLKPGGRLAVISFHSLEDRRVKQFMKAHTMRWENLPEGGRRALGLEPRGTRITRKPIQAEPDERAANPRSRSAKLRVWERIRA